MAQEPALRVRGALAEVAFVHPSNDTTRAAPISVRDDDAVDSFEVPAAVLCTFCGESDCAGCTSKDENASGVIAIIPWERPGAGALSRLFSTAKASTIGADQFFATLPDGEIPPAVRFAVLAELLAVMSMAAVLIPIAAIVLPNLAAAVIANPALRATAVRAIAIGVPALAAWMVIAHVTHGAALDAGARRQGAAPQRRRAVRFGLYACGWDLMAGPLGALVMLVSKGLGSMKDVLDAAVHAPGKSSIALLQGVYRLAPEAVSRARRVGTIAAVIIAIASGFGVLLAIGLALA